MPLRLALIFALAVLAALPARAQTASAQLKLNFGGYVGSECRADPAPVQLAGSQCEIILDLLPASRDFAYRGLPVPPASLDLGATQVAMGVADAKPVPYPLERLQLRFYVTYHQAVADSAFRLRGSIAPRDRYPQYHFLIVLPADLAGKTFCVRAAFDDPDYGHLEGTGCIGVIAPCSQQDRDQVAGSYVKFAFNRRDYPRAIALTDSLLQTGWLWGNGLIDGMMAAGVLKDYARALCYLDTFYETYGTAPFSPERDPARARAAYEKQRALILSQQQSSR